MRGFCFFTVDVQKKRAREFGNNQKVLTFAIP